MPPKKSLPHVTRAIEALPYSSRRTYARLTPKQQHFLVKAIGLAPFTSREKISERAKLPKHTVDAAMPARSRFSQQRMMQFVLRVRNDSSRKHLIETPKFKTYARIAELAPTYAPWQIHKILENELAGPSRTLSTSEITSLVNHFGLHPKVQSKPLRFSRRKLRMQTKRAKSA